MITGRVSNDLAMVPLVIHGSNGTSLSIEAVLDTGFNDSLILSPDLIAALALPLFEDGRYSLADGSSVVARFFAAEIAWMGQRQQVVVLEMDSVPLIGMALLQGCNISIDVREGGDVKITPVQRGP